MTVVQLEVAWSDQRAFALAELKERGQAEEPLVEVDLQPILVRSL